MEARSRRFRAMWSGRTGRSARLLELSLAASPARRRRRAARSIWSPSSTVRRNAAHTASDRTVRRRPDSSSWMAAALVPAGRRDHVAQHRRVVARLLREAGAALERLDDEVVRDVAREAEVDGGVDQRLHHEEHVGGAGPRHRGRHRDPLLVLDLELRAQRAEQRLRLGALVLGAWPASRTRRSCPLPMRAGVLGIARDDLVVAEGRRRGRSSWARRAPTAPAARVAGAGPISRPTRASICGLTARMITSASRIASTLDATTRIPCVPSSAARRSARGWLATTCSGATSLPVQQPDDHGLGHDAGADGGDRPVREG